MAKKPISEVLRGEKRFGRWTFLREGKPKLTPNGTLHRSIECRCDCGVVKTITAASARNGHSQSCGCLKLERSANRGRWGGASTDPNRAPIYGAWKHAVNRCTKPGHPEFENYGGRGIRVCAEWLSDFSAFEAHIGRRPSAKHSLDRVDNNSNYEPGNVRWALPRTQSQNKRNAHLVSIGGETLPLVEVAAKYGIPYNTLRNRIVRSGRAPEDAIADHSAYVGRKQDSVPWRQ